MKFGEETCVAQVKEPQQCEKPDFTFARLGVGKTMRKGLKWLGFLICHPTIGSADYFDFSVENNHNIPAARTIARTTSVRSITGRDVAYSSNQSVVAAQVNLLLMAEEPEGGLTASDVRDAEAHPATMKLATKITQRAR